MKGWFFYLKENRPYLQSGWNGILSCCVVNFPGSINIAFISGAGILFRIRRELHRLPQRLARWPCVLQTWTGNCRESRMVNFCKGRRNWHGSGSGSASRSVYPGFAWWGRSAAVPGSSDEYAIPLAEQIAPGYYGLRDAVLLIDSATKNVSSSFGHELMISHPYKQSRICQANDHAEELLRLFRTNQYDRFFELVEQEAFSLHALMMSSSPRFFSAETKQSSGH